MQKIHMTAFDSHLDVCESFLQRESLNSIAEIGKTVTHVTFFEGRDEVGETLKCLCETNLNTSQSIESKGSVHRERNRRALLPQAASGCAAASRA